MKVSFYKGCYSRHLNVETNSRTLHLASDQNNHDKEWDDNLIFLRYVLHKLVSELHSRQSLNTVYRYYVESEYGEINYDLAVQETPELVYERITKYINDYDLNKESYSRNEFLNLFEEIISTFPQEEDNHHECEQCDDTNYEYEAEVNE